MAIDAGIGLGDLVAGLFSGGAADVAAAGAADVAGADLGAAAAGLGAADVGAAAGAADAIGAGAADIGAGLSAADLGAAAGGAAAADIGASGLGAADTAAATGAADALGSSAADLAPAIDTGALGAFGDVVGPADALNFAPSTGFASPATQAGAAGTLTGASTGVNVAPEAAALESPSTALAGSPDIGAELGSTTQAPAAATTAPAAIAPAGPNITDAAGVQQALEQGEATAPFGSGSTLAGAADAASGAAPAAAAAAPAAASGGSSILSSIPGATTAASVLSNPLVQLGVPGGMLAYNLLKGPAPIPPQAQQAVTNAAQQLGPLQGEANQNVPLFNQTAATDLNLANNFQISPAQAASIEQWKQNQYNQLLQQIANQGITNPMQSSEWVQGKNQIDQQALTQQVQMVNQLVSTAFQAASAANAGISTDANVTSQLDSTLMQAAQLQVQQDTNFQNAVGSALQAFGLIAGLQGSKIANSLKAAA